MAAKLLEITATYLGERFRFENADGDVIVGEAHVTAGPKPENVNGRVGIKGPANSGDLHQGLAYRFFGHWSTYKNRRTGETENQFHFETFVASQPLGRSGIVAYLAKHGEGLGIGKARSAELFDRYGEETLARVKACTAYVAGWNEENKQAFAARLIAEEHLEACSISLVELLERRGFPKSTAKKAIDLWGNCAAEIIRRNPYILMLFRGCGFKRTDSMYLDLGHPPGRLKRQALCAWHTLASDTEGHTWHPVQKAMNGIKQNVSGADLRPVDALVLAKRAGIIDSMRTDPAGNIVDAGGRVWVAEGKKADHEAYVAQCLADAAAEDHSWPAVETILGISEHQAERLSLSFSGTIAILGGRPGTGKTYTAAALIIALKAAFGEETLAVAAPTGKAAVRVTEALATCGVAIRARTIHGLLKVDPLSGSAGGWKFLHNQHNPLPFRFIIVDESSMIDVSLMASLLAARAAGAHILFVGDVNQLAPVGHGAPLRDMIAAGLPYGELREIRRNSGAIVRTCSAIVDEQPWTGCEHINIEAGENLGIFSAATPELQTERILQLLEESKKNGFDPVWECQVIVPVNAKSKVSRKELNKVLQEKLNTQPGVVGCPFRKSDKIVNTKNGYFKLVDGGEPEPEETEEVPGDYDHDAPPAKPDETYVANGEQAEIIEVEEKSLLARLVVSKRIVRIPRGKAKEEGDEPASGEGEDEKTNTGCTWDLAYAISCHKSQGSEWPVVLVVIDEYPGARMVCSREWTYTACSRAKKLCLLIGNEATAKRFCRRVAIGDRKTFLKERIQRHMSELLVAEM